MGKVIVAVDGSELSRHALEWGVRQARMADADLHVVTAAPKGALIAPTQTLYWTPQERLEEEALDLQQGVLREVDDEGVHISSSVPVGHPTKVLCGLAEEADMIVMGSRGLGLVTGALLGSIAHQVVSHTVAPVVVVPGPSDPPRRIVVGVDGSDHSNRAIEWAGRMARRNGAHVELVLVQQWTMVPAMGTPFLMATPPAPDLDAMRQAGSALLEQAAARLGLGDGDITLTRLDGSPADRLLDRAAAAGLLVVGTRGRGGFKGLLLGSVSHRALQNAPCPVAVIP